MSNIAIQKAQDLTPAARETVERLLGRLLRDGEEVSVMAFLPQSPADPHTRDAAARELSAQLDRRAAKVEDVSEEELEDAMDEAMRSVRPGYRPRS